MLAAKAVDHADELGHIFEKGGVAERLAPYMLPILMTSLRATEAQRQELTSNLCLEKTKLEEDNQKSANRSKALEACVQLLNANPRCRNCGIDFSCTLEQTSWYHPRRILRCSRCSCRHEESI
ncbi:hypothetical protein F5B21DRAFT_176567 [Xylaria acuta]|nr:hypothetical protein F5B21DRAFT_176567 [Xylaria acuta]